ncbi:hypothetical protein M378DRAFT_9260 [Amanita muscaria Koide BX008]|uniref:Uncharacterized protein n=1 Tax=Amanita muscaria (strain Koide BX008) TaxID=946122 RepID=A0A0C2SVL3_AMAMK|nr:hypothetical protein M378DRAFT_9260 [Amanita muscaria Koide BX008]
MDISRSFEYVEDVFGDETHRLMDDQVLETCKPPETVQTAASLLMIIVDSSNGKLESKYTNLSECKTLLAKHDGLADELKRAWSHQSFKNIRKMKILNVPSKPKLSNQEKFYRRFNTFPDRAIYTAWKEQYRGNYHEILYNSLNRMRHSSNTVSIIQSSGSGKSRMVDNLAHLVFTIPFNIRPTEDSQYLAFPPPDAQILALLDERGSTDKLHAYYLRFLRHVFEEICIILPGLFCKPVSSYATLATSWRCYLESDGNRQSLYDSVVQAFRQSWYKAELEKNIVVKDFATETRVAFNQLSTAIDCCIKPTRPFEEKIKVVMYFDEFHSLSTVSAPSNKYDRLDVLFAAIGSLSSQPLMVIFLSTVSHMSSAPYARSARARQDWDELQPTITETPFDCGPMLPLASNTLRLQDTCTIEFMAQFGRPLFWTMIQSAGDSKDQVLPLIIDLARSKLLCQNDIDVDYLDVTKHARTAVVDLRLMFDYEPWQEATRAFEAELVASHMRTVFSIPQTLEYFWSGYPSEPLLAEAAAQQMGVFHSKNPDSIVNVLQNNLDSGRLDKVECGELVARALLTLAYDRAIERESKSPATDNSRDWKEKPWYSRGASVITFIEELFASPYAGQILDCIPNNVEDTRPFREVFQNAKVRFTHFGKMADESGTTSDAAWVALIRGMAIIAAKGMCSIDHVIPVLLHKDATICEEAVTGMLISVKTRKTKGNMADYKVDEKTIKFFPHSESTKASQRPYITLAMELGIQPSNSNTSEPTKDKGKKCGSPGTSQLKWQTPSKITIAEPGRQHYPSAHPQYRIFAYGCSNTVYKVITSTQWEKYQFLLASEDFLADHPRKDDDEEMTLLRQMKPFWKAGGDFYHWISDVPNRLSEAEVEPMPEGVITGVVLDAAFDPPEVRPTGISNFLH